MLGKLELKLKSKDKLEYQMSSLFHGALMEVLPEKYADYLHTSQLHPYTQHLEFREGEWYWIICCLNKEAIKIIIQDTLWNIENIEIKNRNLTVLITRRSYSEITYHITKRLLKATPERKCSRFCWTEVPAGQCWMTGWSETSKVT